MRRNKQNNKKGVDKFIWKQNIGLPSPLVAKRIIGRIEGRRGHPLGSSKRPIGDDGQPGILLVGAG